MVTGSSTGKEGASAPSATSPSTPPTSSNPNAGKFGYNSNGEPECYPSDLEMLQNQHGLTKPEAAALWQATCVDGQSESSAVEGIVGQRTVVMPVVATVPAVTSHHGALIPDIPPAPDTPTAVVQEG